MGWLGKMGATQYAFTISMAVLCFAFAVSILNEWNLDTYTQTGKWMVFYGKNTFIEYSAIDIGLNAQQFNSTANNLMDFKKPETISFNFDFFKSLDIARMLYNILIATVWGFPFYLAGLGMPSILVLPLLILMEVSHLLVIIYLVIGKSF